MAFEATGWKCDHPHTPENTLRKGYWRNRRKVYYDRCRTCHNAATNRWHHANREDQNFKRKLRWAGVDATQARV